jgi:hypothetical protein
MPATAEADQEPTPAVTVTVATLPTPEDDTEVAILRGEYFNFFVRIFFPSFFLARLAAMEHELKAAQKAAAGGSNTEPAQKERPKKIENLQKAMSLSNDCPKYRLFCVSPFFILTKHVRT